MTDSRWNLIDMPSLTNTASGYVVTGESFTADCAFAWSMWVNGSDGLFIIGELTPGVPAIGIPFKIKGDELSLTGSGASPMVVTSNLVGYRRYATTEVDGSFIVRYRWPLSWFTQHKTIHMIATRIDDGLKWRVAPHSEPVIQDAKGDKVAVSGGPKDYGITMKSLGRKK